MARDFDLNPADVLGTGISGSVLVATRRITGQRTAVKTFTKSTLKERQMKRLEDEVKLHLQVDHPNICRLLHVYEGGDRVWMVMELCRCELYHRLKELRVFSERRAKEASIQMFKAVSYLHCHNIVHRDLKLENWMYSSSDDAERLKLIDFGFAQQLSYAEEILTVPCGTMLYVSPELLKMAYTLKTDMWSLGVIIFMLLTGRPPFKGENDTKTAHQIAAGFHPQDLRWDGLTTHAQDLVKRLLLKDAGARLDAQSALQHQWLHDGRDGIPMVMVPSGSGRGAASQASGNLWRFGHGSLLQRAAIRMIACSLTSRDLEDFEHMFLELDRAGRGAISRADLQSVVRRHCPNASITELDQILKSLDLSGTNEVSYSGFVAAMLAACIDQHEHKVREAFDAFDEDGSGWLTVASLRKAFVSRSPAVAESAPRLPSQTPDVGLPEVTPLSQAEAEAWMAEVDYKGNGVLDFDGFVAALQGKRRVAVALEDEDRPVVKVYTGLEFDVPKACSLPMLSEASTRSPSEELSDSMSECSSRQVVHWSWSPPRETLFKVREVAYEIDTDYFAMPEY